MNTKKIERVIALNAPDRIGYLIRKIADFEEVWGLYDSGWALMSESIPDIQRAFPVWPEKEFAEICAQGPWKSYCAKKISLNDFIEKWIPGMSDDGTMIAMFPTPQAKAVVVQPNEFLDLIKEELKQYED